ncbi:transglutaminase domain-containing protein [Streptomyces sp. NPDC057298]|uniref:transglutaminase domain-containing protein n=1 Tax=Streptomyces sp. NPDC057298 TaxID=3346091 RepID=UPI00363DD771
MTSRLLMPYRRAERVDGAGVRPPATADVPGSTRPTAILDWTGPGITALVERVRAAGPAGPLDALRVTHGIVAREIRPVYSVEDRRRVSRTLRLGRGSCSQRMAVLEAAARAMGVPTRVRGLLVDGVFWYPRFPRLKPLVPEQVLLAWPEFRPAEAWIPIGELFGTADGDTGGGSVPPEGPLTEPGGGTGDRGAGFTNQGGETLFDAVARTTVDWGGASSCTASGTACDLSARVLSDLGHFDSRDELFARHGQTLCLAARTAGEPVLGRWSAGAHKNPS